MYTLGTKVVPVLVLVLVLVVVVIFVVVVIVFVCSASARALTETRPTSRGSSLCFLGIVMRMPRRHRGDALASALAALGHQHLDAEGGMPSGRDQWCTKAEAMGDSNFGPLLGRSSQRPALWTSGL